MSESYNGSFDPFKEMQNFYQTDDPTPEDQFRFVEAMKYLIDTSDEPIDIIAFSYNLAMYYRDIKEFNLEKKYLEIGEELGEPGCKEQLGMIWYYGLCGEQDYEKAYQYFTDCMTRPSRYMLADMYHLGQYVDQDDDKCRELLEELFVSIVPERNDPRFAVTTLFPEVAWRLARLNYEECVDEMFDLDCLFDARDILVFRQMNTPFWGNLSTMRNILETTVMYTGNDFEFLDLYDLMTFDSGDATVLFDYDGMPQKIDIFLNDGEVIYEFDGKWYHGADDFLEKARIDKQHVTSLGNRVSNIRIVHE